MGKKARKVYSGDIEGFKLANEASDLPCQEKIKWTVLLKSRVKMFNSNNKI